MSRKIFTYSAMTALMLSAALFSGCGSDSREGDTGGVARVEEGACRTCHATTLDPTSNANLVAEFNASAHNNEVGGCQGCHGGGANHNGAGPIPFSDPAADGKCVVCHDDTNIAASLFAAATDFKGKCASCHTATGTGSAHAAQSPSELDKGCVDCHELAAPQHFATTNLGVRAIVSEFAKRSHHVTGRDVTDTDCAVCHLEGQASGTTIAVSSFHMNDGIVNLRNCNVSLTGNQSKASVESGYSNYAWNPTSPDHTLMDQFCFSCHNEAGAPTAVNSLDGVSIAAGGVPRTALNPFGDTVSNDYDQVSRINVVGVFEQFDTANSSHHAVRGKKYNLNALTTAMFTNISTVNYNFINGNVAAPISGTRAANPQYATGLLSGTMFETGKFVATYTVLGTATPVADNSTIHCGDCHTVGQFRAGSAVKADGTPTTVVIGAHGSNNEYMLRNSNSDDTFSRDALVCYLCHKENVYSNPGQTELGQTDGIVAHNSVNNSFADCNGNNENSAGLIGRVRLVPEERELDDATFQIEVAAGRYQPTGGGNIFGIKCANCHNASDNKVFGGIHGNAHNASYTTYSGGKNAAPTTPQTGASVAVSRKPYRFLPGLGNFRYNGGDSDNQWMVKTLTQANRQGCYTINGASTVTRSGARVANPSPTRADASGANVSALAIAGDNGILGSWGACTDHGGTSVFGGRATTRTLLRPLTY